jgi:transposase
MGSVAGIDVSNAWLDVALYPDAVVTRRVRRDDPGFAELGGWLRQQVGLEAFGGYEAAVIAALQAAGVTRLPSLSSWPARNPRSSSPPTCASCW